MSARACACARYLPRIGIASFPITHVLACGALTKQIVHLIQNPAFLPQEEFYVAFFFTNSLMTYECCVLRTLLFHSTLTVRYPSVDARELHAVQSLVMTFNSRFL